MRIQARGILIIDVVTYNNLFQTCALKIILGYLKVLFSESMVAYLLKTFVKAGIQSLRQ